MSGQQKRGFATLDPERQRAIARKGGQVAHGKGTAHEFSSEEARRAGRLGGKAVSANRAHMAEIGRKGGQRTLLRAVSARTAKSSPIEPRSTSVSSLGASVSTSAIVERLRADHRRVNGLFHQYEQSNLASAPRTVVVQQICQELLHHMTFEEELVYPIVRLELAGSEQQLLQNSLRAHARMKELVQQLDGRTSDEAGVPDLMRELQTCVNLHVQEEEREMLPKVEEHADRELQRLGQTSSSTAQEVNQREIPEPPDDTPSEHY